MCTGLTAAPGSMGTQQAQHSACFQVSPLTVGSSFLEGFCAAPFVPPGSPPPLVNILFIASQCSQVSSFPSGC